MSDLSQPTAGFYRHTLVRGGPPVGVRLWHGAPLDPVTGDVLDRAPRWQAEVNGHEVEVERIWPQCMGEAIDEAEYRFLCAAHEHALANDPHNALAAPVKRVDWDSASPPEF